MRRFCLFLPLLLFVLSPLLLRAQEPVIPADLVVSKTPKPVAPVYEGTPQMLSALSVGTTVPVFPAPPCLDGQYYAVFRLFYDYLPEGQTEINWTADLSISLLDNTTVLWTKPLSVSTANQTFESFVFHDALLSCGTNFTVRIDAKTVTGTAPVSNIRFQVLLHKYVMGDVFVPTAAMTLTPTAGTERSIVTWTNSGAATMTYDLEWVFIAAYEGSPTTAVQAFGMKEPVRITTTFFSYNHSIYYPTGKIFYRVRAVGYSNNPLYPEHRIPGNWTYGPNAGMSITNHQADINWQSQTIFAEEGKYKKIMHYYDGSLRERQIQTNLSTSGDTALVGETFYDFEGRRAVDVLAVPTTSVSLKYKAAFNPLQSQHSSVTGRVSAKRKKFHYDNDILTNSIATTAGGAGMYYSSANTVLMEAARKDYIPNAEGYVFSSTEYLRDGTGRVKRQSDVGKEFRMDGGRPTEYYYGTPAPVELIRLFGSNVGNANHYKKNMVVDPNKQTSVSYLDQEGRVIATALAGTPPTNVTPLASYTSLPSTQLVVDISTRNVKRDNVSQLSQKIMNAVPATPYTFVYNFSALGSAIDLVGCVECKFDLKITLTDPDGTLVSINSPAIPGNTATDGSYERKNISAADCEDPTVGADISFAVTLARQGDYTITKTLTPADLTFEDARELVEQIPSVQTRIQELENYYAVDSDNCEICTSRDECPAEADAAIDNAIVEIANMDCENLYQRMISELTALHAGEPLYDPVASIHDHEDYCQYELCLRDKNSAIYEKRMALVANWTDAVSKGYNTALSNVLAVTEKTDPFFNNAGLGYSARLIMQGKLNVITIPNVLYDSNNDGIGDTPLPTGTILQVTDPANTNYYVTPDGKKTPSGRHVLYYDLKLSRDNNLISETEYQAELDKQRWIMFKMFYQEAKRKTKLEIPAYTTCAAAKAELDRTDELPVLGSDIKDWGVENGVLIEAGVGVTGWATDEDIDAIVANIKFNCNATFTPTEITQIEDHIKAYFDSDPLNFLRRIYEADLSTNSHLVQIQNILNPKGCSLEGLATDDLTGGCVERRYITESYYSEDELNGINGRSTGQQQALLFCCPNGPPSDTLFSICVKYDTLRDWSFPVHWEQVIQKCIANATAEKETLIAYAVDNIIEEEAANFYNAQRTKCLDGLDETLTYAYVPKEYHYTLYYYDQAGNLVQTVPPEGVKVLDQPQIDNVLAGNPVFPGHKYVTNYQYNSLNQPVWQRTPDAGESRFWYNDKGQIRLSQNAQQAKDKNYSYSRYDDQARIVEVGEMNTTVPLSTLQTELEDIAFPSSVTYTLTDIIKTYYDLAKSPVQASFTQEYLRSRVSWTEMYEKNATDVLATYYSYDLHGNVKAVLQQIPALGFKRTDYAYDLISGNVNYVFYQYGQPEQLIHRYRYDADNRLVEAATSVDGYLFDVEAKYKYYPHGPLARVVLGQHRVQGLDYYYTLQGWVKGVNMPYAAEQGNDGNTGGINFRVGRDVFSYALGYYENDYKPQNAAKVIADTRDNLWTRYKSMYGSTQTGLFNGNISWMITDLKKIGQQKAARVKGMQAEMYRYDQLHRLVQGRSLTTYTATGGFGTRTASPAAYDEDFSYDGNGNLLTLKRRDNLAALADDFTYTYYTNTNKLRYFIPITRDTTYSGAIIQNNKVYDRIDVQGTAFVPAGKDVTIKAINNIDFADGFDIQSNATFRAYVLPDDEGAFNYDAIGNIIWDQDKGVKISWTPYGKVRQVSKNDGTVINFRYDASGNRIEKKMIRPDNTTIITRYVRDASGNVMSVYSGRLLSEQPIYGSSRLGSYKGGMHRALRKLGTKNFELSNHLGNVLSVITDNIRMTADSTWATVMNANDYYAFGSSMPGRQISTPAPNASDRSLVLPGFTSGDNSKILEDISNDFTVELWVNPTGTHEVDAQSASGTAGMTGQKYVIHPALGPTTTRAGMGISVGTNGVSVYEQTTSYMPATLVWTGTISGWTHIAVVYSNQRPNLYINGVFVKQGVVSGKSLVHPSFGFMGSPQGSMAGSVDEIRIWNVIRTPTELLASYNTTIPSNTPNLAAYWPLNEGSGTILHDASQHGLDHAVVNYTAWSATGSGAPVTGNSDGQGNEYRYGFNGKERDENGEFGDMVYDYGFRIYNPRIGRFLSVDPLTKEYPWYTPYQFAGNKPINSIDRDGLEEYPSYSAYKKDKGDAALEKMDGSDGAWLASDRGSQVAAQGSETVPTEYNNVFATAAEYNLKNLKTENYQTLVQRKQFYNWFDDYTKSKGFETKWSGAAEGTVGNLELLLYPLSEFFGASNDEIKSFVKAGNKRILDDMMPRMKALIEGPVLKGQAAFEWDGRTLAAEQKLIHISYLKLSNASFIKLENSVQQNTVMSEIVGFFVGGEPFKGSLRDISDRWIYGMDKMHYDVDRDDFIELSK